MTEREAFLARVRQSVAEGNRAGVAPSLPVRGKVGHQGAGPNPVERFCKELAAAGGKGYIATNAATVHKTIEGILKGRGLRKILVSRGGLIERLDIAKPLRESGLDVTTTDMIPEPAARESMFAAEVGISNVYRLVAETGTVVVASRPNEPRSVSLLPPIHIAVAERAQLMPDLFDLFDLFAPGSPALPSCLSLITGPSKTGDIELRLVTGVHGPGEVHVILCDW